MRTAQRAPHLVSHAPRDYVVRCSSATDEAPQKSSGVRRSAVLNAGALVRRRRVLPGVAGGILDGQIVVAAICGDGEESLSPPQQFAICWDTKSTSTDDAAPFAKVNSTWQVPAPLAMTMMYDEFSGTAQP